MTTLYEQRAPGANLLGLGARTTDELISAFAQGLPTSTLDRLAQAAGLPREETLRLIGLSPRTYARRLSGGRLNAEESERAVRLARVVERAHDSFGRERGNGWLSARWPALNNRTPLGYAGTDIGAEAVIELIAALEEGIFV